ncbi:MAG: hypothetical protein NVS4B1_33420 [Ktedonobacteraceae bacterium]
MGKYLTVSQYKRVGEGVSLADVTDLNLAYFIARAEAAIDADMGFDSKRGGFEAHQLMMQQAYTPRTRKTFITDSTVPIRQVTRYRIQVSNLALAGAGFFANISPGECVINNDGHYVEIVPLQAIMYSLTPILVELGLDPPIVEIDCEVGFYLQNIGERVLNSGDNQTYYALNGFWATTYTQALAAQPNLIPPIPPIVYTNGVVVSAANYTIDAVEGSVTFTTVQSPTSVISLDYTATIPGYVSGACVLQVTHLLGQRNLNKLGMYEGLYQMRSGEQQISYPRSINIGSVGRAALSPLCDKAAAMLGNYEGIGIA